MEDEFKDYQQQVVKNAKVMADELANQGLRIVSGGTDTHLMLVDVTPLGITGKDAEIALDIAGITVNKNTIPFDQNPPMVCSGVRLGAPAVTTRGMKENEMKTIANLIVDALKNSTDENYLAQVKAKVKDLTQAFPIYKEYIDKYSAKLA
jgi:glycine hydroxymethyltransferase